MLVGLLCLCGPPGKCLLGPCVKTACSPGEGMGCMGGLQCENGRIRAIYFIKLLCQCSIFVVNSNVYIVESVLLNISSNAC